MQQDLIGRLLERKPGRRLGMLSGRARDIKRHRWFEGMDWEAMAARRVQPPRIPQDDAAKRMRELAVRTTALSVLSLWQLASSHEEEYLHAILQRLGLL
jgi:hypothetical protein